MSSNPLDPNTTFQEQQIQDLATVPMDKVNSLSVNKQDKMSRFGIKADSNLIPNTFDNEYNPAEMQFLLQELASNKQLTPEGDRSLYGENIAYDGPTGRFYAFGTNREGQIDGLRDIKPGFAGGHWPNSEARYEKFAPGPEGVNVDDKLMDFLLPEQTARAYEALVRGNVTARDQRVAPYSEELADANKDRFGSGYTEILGRREDNTGIFGDAALWGEIPQERKDELLTNLADFETKVFRSMYPDYSGEVPTLQKFQDVLPEVKETSVEPNGSDDKFENLKQAMLKRESNGDYTITNQLGYVGGYQFGSQALETLGYLKEGSSKGGNKALNDPNNWTGKNGLNSVEDFKTNTAAQDLAFEENADFNLGRLESLGVIDSDTTESDIAGYIAASHLLGAGGARDLDSEDANGTSGREYFDLGSKAINTTFTPTQTSTKRKQPTAGIISGRDIELKRMAEEASLLDRSLAAPAKAAGTLFREVALDFSDLVGEGLNSVTDGTVGWDHGTDEEKTQWINETFGLNPFYAEEDYAKAKVHADSLVNAIYDENKEVNFSDAYELVKIGITTPEMLADSVGFLASFFVPFLGWGGKAAKAKKINDAHTALKAGRITAAQAKAQVASANTLGTVRVFAQNNAGLMQVSANNVNDQIDAYKKEHGSDPSVTKVASMFATESLLLGLDRWADLSILKSPSALKGVRDAFTGLSIGDKTRVITKTLGVAGGLAVNMGKEAVQEYLQEIGQEFNVKFNFDDNGDFLSAVDEAGKVLLDKEVQTSGVLGAGLGAGGAVQFAGLGVVGKGVTALGATAPKIKAAVAKETPTPKEEPDVVDTPSNEGFERRVPYELNNQIIEGNEEGITTVVNKVNSAISNNIYTEGLKGRSKEEAITVAKEAASVLGYSNNTKALDTLIGQVAEALGVSVEEVESPITVSYAEAKTIADIEKTDAELGKTIRKASNLAKAGELSKNTELVKELKEIAIESGDSKLEGIVSSIFGKKVERKNTETKAPKKTIKDVADQVKDVSESKTATETVISDVESKDYVLGSSKEALDKIVELSNLQGTNTKAERRIKTAINKLTTRNSLDKEVVRLLIKSSSTVEEEATTGKRGYKTYGELLKRLSVEGKEAESEVVKDKLNVFLASQQQAVDSLQEAINKVESGDVVAGEPVVSEFKKLDGKFFDIGISRFGKPFKGQLEEAKKLRDLKANNVAGITEALGNKTTKTEEVAVEPTIAEETVTVEVKTEEVQPEVIVEEVVETTVQPKAVKSAPIEEVVEEPKVAPTKAEKLLDALQFAMNGLRKGESDQDIINGLMVKGLPENVAKKALEKAKADESPEVTELPPKGVMKDILKDSLYKSKKAFAVVKGKAKLTSAEPAKGTTGVIQRNPSEYLKISRETTLNTVKEFNSDVMSIIEKAKATMNNVIKPLHRYEKNLTQYGGLESADSPSRGLLFNSKGELNDNVVLAIRAALVESVNFDKDLFSKEWKTKDDVARMLGKTNSNDVSKEIWDLVKDQGIMLDTVGNALGDKIVSLLGLSESTTASDVQAFARLKADLGGAAVQMAVADGILEFTSVTATDFAKAMGEEATSKDAKINFVSFKTGDKPSKQVVNEANVLEEGIKELTENRSDIYLDKIPSNVVKRRTANYHNGKIGLTPSKTHQKALKKLMDTEWEFDRELAAELMDNKEAFLKNAGYIDEASPQFGALSYSDRNGQKGKNRKVLKDVEAMEKIINDSTGNTSLWFEWYTTVNQRVMIDSNTINPMNDKYGHRWVVQPKGMETKVSKVVEGKEVKFSSEGKDISKEVRYSLAQAFGMSVDKKDTKKINKFANALINLNTQELAKVKTELLSEGETTIAGGHTLEVEHLGHTLQGLKFLENSLKGEEFTTKLSAEFDAVTSGFGLKLLQMPIINNIVQYLAKVGVVIPSKGTKNVDSMNDLLDSEGFLDNYETLASEIDTDISYKDILETITNREEHEMERLITVLGGKNKHAVNSNTWKSLNAILPKTVEGEVNKELRTLFKDPFMTFNYARSINNIKRGLASTIIEGMVSSLTSTPIDKLSTQQKGLLKTIDGLTGNKPTSVKAVRKMLRDKDLSTIAIPTVNGKGNLQEYLQTFVELSYGEEVSRIFFDQFEPFIAAQDVLTNSFKYAFEVFDYEYKKRLDQTRKLEGTLTADNKKEILRELLEVFPLIDGPMSEQFRDSMEVMYLKAKDGDVEGNFNDGSLSVFKETRQRGDDILPTQFAVNGEGSKVINPKLREFASPGVGGSVLPIHSIDAAILLSTFLDKGDMLLIHDAIIPKLDKMNDSVKQYNKHVMGVNRDYSFISSVNDMVKRVDNFSRLNSDIKRDNKTVDWRPKDVEIEEGATFNLRDMRNSVVIDTQSLSNKVQNGRSSLFSIIDSDPDAKIMHMAGMKDGVYSQFEDAENKVKDEISDEFSGTISDMLNNLQDIINKPCN